MKTADTPITDLQKKRRSTGRLGYPKTLTSVQLFKCELSAPVKCMFLYKHFSIFARPTLNKNKKIKELNMEKMFIARIFPEDYV